MFRKGDAMIKKICIVGLVICCVILSGCTIRTKNGDLYINVDDRRETKTYHSIEKQLLDKDTFWIEIDIGDVDIGLSSESLYDLSTIVKYRKGDSPKAPKIDVLRDKIRFSVDVGKISGTIAESFNAVKLEMGVGDAELFLSSGSFENIDVDIGIGNVDVFLPEKGEGTVIVEVGTGNVKIVVSKNIGYLLHYDMGIGAFSINVENSMIEKGTVRINPEKEVTYEIWVEIGIGHIEVSE